MREFETTFVKGLKRGLREDVDNPRNEEALVECLNAKPSEEGLIPIVPVTTPMTVSMAWPFPQVLATSAVKRDSTTVISSTSDVDIGYFSNLQASTWDYVHDLATGTYCVDFTRTSFVRAQRYIGTPDIVRHAMDRSFFYFDLSGISGTVVGCLLRLMGYPWSGATIPSVAVQEGTQADPATTADFDSFTGVFFGVNESWVVDDFNTIEFNSTGIAYIQSVVDASGTALLCCREYDHDYLDVAPEGVVKYATYTYFADHAIEANRPALIVYTVA